MRLFSFLVFVTLLAGARSASAFCGFYVAKADTDLFNNASKVVLVRDGERTVMTMANDYRGEAEEFAIVIPVPTFLEREQIHVADKALIDHLYAYTSPRLVEYSDEDPCQRWALYDGLLEEMRKGIADLPLWRGADDRRLTRKATNLGFSPFGAQLTRYGELALELLCHLAGRPLETPAAARAWWAQVQERGESKRSALGASTHR